METIRNIRILIQYGKEIKTFFKIALGQDDTSLYFFPYGPLGKYSFGSRSMNDNEIMQTFSYEDQYKSEKIPKLSIHESGQVHIRSAKNSLAGPIYTIPLKTWQGEHIATVTTDSFRALSNYEGNIRTKGAEIDHIVPCDDKVNSGRFIVYCNAHSPRFIRQCRLTITMQRPSLKNHLYFGFSPCAQMPLESAAKNGITIVAGWNPRKGIESRQDYLYIRAQ